MRLQIPVSEVNLLQRFVNNVNNVNNLLIMLTIAAPVLRTIIRERKYRRRRLRNNVRKDTESFKYGIFQSTISLLLSCSFIFFSSSSFFFFLLFYQERKRGCFRNVYMYMIPYFFYSFKSGKDAETVLQSCELLWDNYKSED